MTSDTRQQTDIRLEEGQLLLQVVRRVNRLNLVRVLRASYAGASGRQRLHRSHAHVVTPGKHVERPDPTIGLRSPPVLRGRDPHVHHDEGSR